jgi:hypothetical protein
VGEEKIDYDDLAMVLRNAEHRRAEDLSAWLGQLFQEWSRHRATDANAGLPTGHPALR